MQLAEKWLMKFSKLFQDPYSLDAYHRAIKEAEQFMWAGHEMDPVRFQPYYFLYLLSPRFYSSLQLNICQMGFR